MRPSLGNLIESARIRQGPLASDSRDGRNGAFEFRCPISHSTRLFVIASDGLGWEHVSVSTRGRCPTWEEMCWVKDLFWGEEECVIQYHPPRSVYVKTHPHCLHLWKPTVGNIETPPTYLIGFDIGEERQP